MTPCIGARCGARYHAGSNLLCLFSIWLQHVYGPLRRQKWLHGFILRVWGKHGIEPVIDVNAEDVCTACKMPLRRGS